MRRGAILLVYLIAITWCSAKTKVIKANSVKVLLGTHQCISDCTHKSANNNRTISCSVDECSFPLQTASHTAQSPEIEEVFFERYTNEQEKRNRLALHIKWSPVDNVSLEHTRGYVVNITDGKSSYSTCYNITSKMNFHDNGHDIFYNDCFGKVNGTFVTPGSVITVTIRNLPRWNGPIDDGSTTVTVNVPDCTNEALHVLKECETEGGRPTTRSCAATDCDTYSVVDDVAYEVSCSLSLTQLTNLGGPEKCVDVNKTIEGSPSQPRRVPQSQEWYKYTDPDDGEVKIALNFSWMPQPDSSIKDIHGYHLLITPRDKSSLVNFNKCFAVHTLMEEKYHSNANFFYDCYGRIHGSIVEPNLRYIVHLTTIPETAHNSLSFELKIPNCADPAMQDVTHCISQNGRKVRGKVEGVFCENRSMIYNYSVTEEYGKLATIVLCEQGEKLQYCKIQLLEMENVAPNNVLYNISLPSAANLSINYTIYVHGSDYPYERSKDHPDFSKCVVPDAYSTMYVVITVILVVGILILLGVIFLLCFTQNTRCSLRKLKRLRATKTGETGTACYLSELFSIFGSDSKSICTEYEDTKL